MIDSESVKGKFTLAIYISNISVGESDRFRRKIRYGNRVRQRIGRE